MMCWSCTSIRVDRARASMFERVLLSLYSSDEVDRNVYHWCSVVYFTIGMFCFCTSCGLLPLAFTAALNFNLRSLLN